MHKFERLEHIKYNRFRVTSVFTGYDYGELESTLSVIADTNIESVHIVFYNVKRVQ